LNQTGKLPIKGTSKVGREGTTATSTAPTATPPRHDDVGEKAGVLEDAAVTQATLLPVSA